LVAQSLSQFASQPVAILLSKTENDPWSPIVISRHLCVKAQNLRTGAEQACRMYQVRGFGLEDRPDRFVIV
jgi:hypothetical protein